MTGRSGDARARGPLGLATALALLLALACLLVAGRGRASAADLPAGEGALSYQIRTTHTDDRTGPESTLTDQDLGLLLSQEIPNYGFLRLEAHGIDPADDGPELGWRQLALTDLKLRGAVAALALGDSAIDAGLLPRRLLILVDPGFNLEGATLALAYGPTAVTLFGGRAVARNGSFGTELTRLDQDVAGLRLRDRIAPGATLSALYIHTEGNGALAGGRVPRGTDSAGFGADIALWGPLALVGEARYASDANAAGAPGRTDGLSYAVGPLLEQPGLRLEATAFSLDPAYVAVEGSNPSADRRGFYGGLNWDLGGTFGLFGSGLRSRNNLADDASLATIETTQVIAGGRAYFPILWPVTALVRGEWTRLDSLSTPSSTPVDSTTTAVFGEVSQVIGAWRPIVRTRWSRLDDEAIGQSSTTIDLAGEFRWQVTRRARLWTALEWSDVSASVGLSESSLYLVRIGGEQRVSAALFLRGEAELSRTEATGVDTTRAGFGASVVYRHRLFDVYLDVRRSMTDTSTGVGERTDDIAYLRVTVPFRWGRPTPPPIGRAGGDDATGWGVIDGHAFVDLDGDGKRSPGEPGLEGLRVLLDGLPGTAVATDRDGRFRFPRVAAGPHSVRLEVKRLPAEYDLVTAQLVEATVERRETATVDFVVQPLGRVTGQIEWLRPSPDGPARPAGRVESISLFLRRGEDIWQTYTDAEGRFSFDNLRAGQYELLVDPAALPDDALVEPPSQRLSLDVGQATEAARFTIRQPARPEIRTAPARRGPAAGRRPASPAAAGVGAAAGTPSVAPSSRRPADRSRDCFGDSPEPGMIGFFRFQTDSHVLVEMADQEGEFQRWVAWLRADPTRRLLIEGHTDPRGDDPHNFGLGARRALAVYERLISAGAPPDRLSLVAEGPDLPCDTGGDQAAWARNRRTLLIVDAPR